MVTESEVLSLQESTTAHTLVTEVRLVLKACSIMLPPAQIHAEFIIHIVVASENKLLAVRAEVRNQVDECLFLWPIH